MATHDRERNESNAVIAPVDDSESTTPIDETCQQRDHYRPRPLTPERYAELLALKSHVCENAYDGAIDIPFRGDPGDAWIDETYLAERSAALLEVLELLHLGHTPNDVVAERCGVHPLGSLTVQDLLGYYRHFSRTGVVQPLRELVRFTTRIKLARAVIRLRLKKRSIGRIVTDVVAMFPRVYPNGVSVETVRQILKRYELNARDFKVRPEAYYRCRSDDLQLERALMAHVRKYGGYLPPLSEKNGAKRRSEIRQAFVASKANIETSLNWREAYRLWLKDLKAWAAENAPKACEDEIAGRRLWNQKLDEWLADPVFAWVLGKTVVENAWIRRIISDEIDPELLTWPLRKRMQWIFSRRQVAEWLELPNTYRRWQRAGREWARAVKAARRRADRERAAERMSSRKATIQ